MCRLLVQVNQIVVKMQTSIMLVLNVYHIYQLMVGTVQQHNSIMICNAIYKSQAYIDHLPRSKFKLKVENVPAYGHSQNN